MIELRATMHGFRQKHRIDGRETAAELGAWRREAERGSPVGCRSFGYDGSSRSVPGPASSLPAPVERRFTPTRGQVFRAVLSAVLPPLIRDQGATRVDP